jgi:hypothetical protein
MKRGLRHIPEGAGGNVKPTITINEDRSAWGQSTPPHPFLFGRKDDMRRAILATAAPDISDV